MCIGLASSVSHRGAGTHTWHHNREVKQSVEKSYTYIYWLKSLCFKLIWIQGCVLHWHTVKHLKAECECSSRRINPYVILHYCISHLRMNCFFNLLWSHDLIDKGGDFILETYEEDLIIFPSTLPRHHPDDINQERHAHLLGYCTFPSQCICEFDGAALCKRERGGGGRGGAR